MARLILKRLVDDRSLLLGVFAGVVLTTTIAAAGPAYLNSLEQLSFRTSVGSIGGRFLGADIFATNVALSDRTMSAADEAVSRAAERHLSPAYAGHTTYVRSSPYLVGIPGRELPDERTREVLLRGYLQSLSGLDEHAAVSEGRLNAPGVAQGPRGPVVEAVISRQTAERFGIGAWDTLTLATVVEVNTRISALVTGVIEAADPGGEFWAEAEIYLDPAPLFETPPYGVRVDPDDPPIGLFVRLEDLIAAVDGTNPGTLVDPVWFTKLDKNEVGSWSVGEATARVDSFTEEVREVMPEVVVRAGAITTTIATVERRSFLAGVPILLLLAVMGVTVLFYMAMVVSYLVKRRERDTALARSRGVGTAALLRIYAAEGLIITGAGAAVGLLLAFGAVSLSGMLPYFSEMTGGGLMHVELESGPLLFAGAAALACLLVLVVPGTLSARAGLLFQKLSVSRPPSVSWFHRYYVDVAVLVVGGLVFWELHSRGQVVSGGLFGDVGVNEPLLLAPVLFLAAVGLLFVRLFPLVLRYVSGESQGLVHVLAASSALAAAAGIVLREGTGLADPVEALPLAALAAFALAYAYAARPRGRAAFAVGLAGQALALAAFFALDPPDARGWEFVADLGLAAVIPATAAFPLFRTLVRRSPVWLAMTLWHMGRNPLQYTWLVLLLVLVTGLGILATTVGGTLTKSRTERILYEVGTDIRVTGSPLFIRGGMRKLGDDYEADPAIAAASASMRTSGSAGPQPVEVLALDVDRFQHMAWFRSDFSDRPMSEVLAKLAPGGAQGGRAGLPGIVIPDDAVEIGAWVKPLSPTLTKGLWLVLADAEGRVETVTAGDLEDVRWRLLRGEVPPDLARPVRLVSVQVFEPGAGPGQISYLSATGAAGAVLIDDIHTVGADGSVDMVEDFEGGLQWTPIVTSFLPTDILETTSGDTHGGELAALFTYGAYRNMSVRGLLHGRDSGVLPVVVSASLAASMGLGAGDRFIAVIAGRLALAEVVDSVRYFPTMGGSSRRFMIAHVDTLYEYLNMLSPVKQAHLNEVFVSVSPGEGSAAEDVILEGRNASFLEVENGIAMLDALLLDPFSGAGWQAVVLLAVAVAVLSIGFGYGTYLLLFAKEGRNSLAFLQSVGMSRGHLAALLAFENLIIAAAGMGLGTWAGFQVSELMVSPLAVTESGESVVPPFILRTDWWIMGPTYAMFAAIFAGSAAVLLRGVTQLDLQAIARAGES